LFVGNSALYQEIRRELTHILNLLDSSAKNSNNKDL